MASVDNTLIDETLAGLASVSEDAAYVIRGLVQEAREAREDADAARTGAKRAWREVADALGCEPGDVLATAQAAANYSDVLLALRCYAHDAPAVARSLRAYWDRRGPLPLGADDWGREGDSLSTVQRWRVRRAWDEEPEERARFNAEPPEEWGDVKNAPADALTRDLGGSSDRVGGWVTMDAGADAGPGKRLLPERPTVPPLPAGWEPDDGRHRVGARCSRAEPWEPCGLWISMHTGNSFVTGGPIPVEVRANVETRYERRRAAGG